ncbi:MAG: hypothetical protein HYZ14_17150 [Bacteroidetes bacterium]|nr:hypothetical protein [Bacteroidota bacterium]
MYNEIEWREVSKTEIEGWCPELPDNYCRFSIIREAENDLYVKVPTTIGNAIKLPFNDRKEAQHFCVRFLKKNLAEIVRYQIQSMKAVYGGETKMQVRYYEVILDRLIEEEAVKRIRTSSRKNVWKKTG